MITFTTAPAEAFTTARISSSTKESSPSLRALMLITISTSSAPAFTASEASKAFALVSMAPSGNPTTQHVFTPLPFNCSATSGTKQVLTQTDANLCSLASLQYLMIVSLLASAFSIV